MNQFKELWRKNNTEKGILGYVEKPGQSIHSEKWDRCVAEVGSDPSVNAYAICTSQLGVESFKSLSGMKKSQLDEVLQELDKMGIGEAGPIPNSLLARQDLETSKSYEIGDKVSVVGTNIEGEITHIQGIERKQYKVGGKYWSEESIQSPKKKGSVEQTGKDLIKIDEEAYEIDSSEERDALVTKLQNTQKRRQRATIIARKSSFKELWKRI